MTDPNPPEPPIYPDAVPPHQPEPEDSRFQRMDISDMETAAEAASEFEAESIRAVLLDAGVKSLYAPSGSNLWGFPMRTDGKLIPIKVLPEDLSAAREALARAKFIGDSVDWDDADMGDVPPEVQAELDRGKGGRVVSNTLRIIGAVVAGIIVVLVAIFGLGCTYQLRGRAIEGSGSIEITDESDRHAGDKGLAGVQITLIRDHDTGNRERVASATSAADGSFTLTVEAFGAGWMEEEWLIRAARNGFQNAETLDRLPSSTSGRLLLISLARGRSEKFTEPERSSTVYDEASKYEPSLGKGYR